MRSLEVNLRFVVNRSAMRYSIGKDLRNESDIMPSPSYATNEVSRTIALRRDAAPYCLLRTGRCQISKKALETAAMIEDFSGTQWFVRDCSRHHKYLDKAKDFQSGSCIIPRQSFFVHGLFAIWF